MICSEPIKSPYGLFDTEGYDAQYYVRYVIQCQGVCVIVLVRVTVDLGEQYHVNRTLVIQCPHCLQYHLYRDILLALYIVTRISLI